MINLKTLGYGEQIQPQAPADAAAVILFREIAGRPWEVLLLKRHERQRFMAGASVFPGGRLEDEDCAPAFIPYIYASHRAEEFRLREGNLSLDRARGLLLAAIRETFEETGVLLACLPSGKPLTDTETGRIRLAGARRKLKEGHLSFFDLPAKEGLNLDFRLLTPYAHWITPSLETRRFDTRFFLAPLPAGQIPLHDENELAASFWQTPRGALESHEEGAITLMPPTIKILEELSAYATGGELLRDASQKEIPALLPEVFSTGQTVGIRFPHDPEYGITAHKQPPRPGETSRVLLSDGRWRRIIAGSILKT